MTSNNQQQQQQQQLEEFEQENTKSPTKATKLLISSLNTLFNIAKEAGLCPIASTEIAVAQFQHAIPFSTAVTSIQPPHHSILINSRLSTLSRCKCLDRWRHPMIISTIEHQHQQQQQHRHDDTDHHHHHHHQDEVIDNDDQMKDDQNEHEHHNHHHHQHYDDDDDEKHFSDVEDYHHKQDHNHDQNQSKNADLRREMRNLCDEQKMQLVHHKMMSQYKRNKAKQLENNIIQLFKNQYTRLDRDGYIFDLHQHQQPQQQSQQQQLQQPQHQHQQQQQQQQRLHGCQHYARKCKLKAKCCNLFVSCRFCHDEAMEDDHEMDRFITEKILCIICLTEQDISEKCINCNESFSHYFCDKCRFYENTPEKKIYHCDRCNICRLGEGLGIDNYHCDICDACVSLSSKAHHKCLSKALHSNCPVCRGYLFTSTEPVVFMRCGHTMHSKCFDEYTSTCYHCPLCMRSLTNMDQHFERLDEIVRNQKMPTEYLNKRSRILCNDCGKKTITSFHFMYHKCQISKCHSYNTTVLDVFDVDYTSTNSRDLSKMDTQLDNMMIDSFTMDFGNSSSSRSNLSTFTEASSQYETSVSSSYT